MEVVLEVSARHLHITKEDFLELFGKDELTKLRDISQPGQFAANEVVTLTGPKGSIENARILGPFRAKTQVEVSTTDCFRLGIAPNIAISGDLDQASSITISGPEGAVVRSGAIVAERHLHLSSATAEKSGLKQGDIVSAETKGKRAVVFKNVVVRTEGSGSDSFQIDTDEANAAGAKTGDMAIIIVS